ncbi:hypothetical protein V494_03393 [Pseudogymnoascus sp. VKM F-4513 (FW-928)]|nr:hypothetical protein V494_03393 [Pseudogymnoascus sp. VKM F-4513 (FW-928)]
MRAVPDSEDEDHALDCYYRGAGSNSTATSSNRQEAVSDETPNAQRKKARQAKKLPKTPRDPQGRILLADGVHSPDNFSETSEATHIRNEQDQTRYEDTTILPEGLELGSAEAAKEASVHEASADLLINTETDTTSLGGTNAYTNGTEFYGGSSNLAFLDSLFSWARKRARSNSHDDPNNSSKEPRDTEKLQDSESGSQHLSNNHLSIVNLMYNATAGYPDSAPDSINRTNSRKDVQNTGSSPKQTGFTERGLAGARPDTFRVQGRIESGFAGDLGDASASKDTGSSSFSQQSVDTKYRDVEKIFVDSYFTNKHYIHPLLCERAFRVRCAKEVWDGQSEVRLRRPQGYHSKFLSLYYAVIALGAINAGIDNTSPLATYYRNWGNYGVHDSPKKHATLEWANRYFNLAKQALGDVFESASLETCQTLFLMTVFCQNALKPHACFMYSGMAVRTAIAIGLGNKMSPDLLNKREEARRTWWSIYSHEVEMCCSSGRLDSLKDPRHYSTLLPKWMNESDSDPSELEGPEVAMIPVMVGLSRILKTASQDIYHDSTRSIQEKSHIGFQLEESLMLWKNGLPSFLNIDSVSLNDTEWAFKQKLVLRMRLYNARILIHRPFLVASSTSYNSSQFSQHVEICLDASRKTIQMIHDCFAHRIYLRTWWYCTTYTLYASMIILHLILLEFPKVSQDELIQDVEKSLEIFSAMKFVIARRCAELTKEILAVAKRYLRQTQSKHSVTMPGSSMFQVGSISNDYDDNLTNGSETWDDSFLMTFLNQGGPGPVRATALADLLNPTVLEDFAMGSNTLMDLTDFGAASGEPHTAGSELVQQYSEGDGILGYHFPRVNTDFFNGGTG